MKKFTKLMLIIVVILSVALTGVACSLFEGGNEDDGTDIEGTTPEDSIASPVLTSFDSYVIWDFVEEAVGYIVSVDDVEQAETTVNYFNVVDNGQVAVKVKAVHETKGSSKYSNSLTIGDASFAPYEIMTIYADGNSHSIPAMVSKVIVSQCTSIKDNVPDSARRYLDQLVVENRTSPLLIELDEVTISANDGITGIGTSSPISSSSDLSSLLIVRAVGDGSSSINGGNGRSGEDGKDAGKMFGVGGDGYDGEQGLPAIRWENVLIDGVQDLHLNGGTGGYGGDGGSGKGNNSGDGGNGGTGGYALEAANYYENMYNSSVDFGQSSGGGAGYSPKNWGILDSGKHGSRGRAGGEYTGTLIVLTDLPTFGDSTDTPDLIEIALPIFANNVFIEDGTTHTVELIGKDIARYSIIDGASEEISGLHTVSIAINDDSKYAWKDISSRVVLITWEIVDVKHVTIALDDDGESYTLSDFRSALKNITIPSTYKNLPITTIGGFEGDLKSVVIPNCVKEISESAFEYCRGLNNIIIPKSVTKIGSSAFAGDITFYAESESMPAEWDINWSGESAIVHWGETWEYTDGVPILLQKSIVLASFGDYIMWDAIDGAVGYVVNIEGFETTEITANYFKITAYDHSVIKVKSRDKSNNYSKYSASLTIGDVEYESNRIMNISADGLSHSISAEVLKVIISPSVNSDATIISRDLKQLIIATRTSPLIIELHNVNIQGDNDNAGIGSANLLSDSSELSSLLIIRAVGDGHSTINGGNGLDGVDGEDAFDLFGVGGDGSDGRHGSAAIRWNTVLFDGVQDLHLNGGIGGKGGDGGNGNGNNSGDGGNGGNGGNSLVTFNCYESANDSAVVFDFAAGGLGGQCPKNWGILDSGKHGSQGRDGVSYTGTYTDLNIAK